jgi:peptidoglycan/LPS O-acetylase OafA/YrhL
MVERRGAFQAGDLVEFLRRRWYRTLPNYYLYLPIHFFLEPRSPGVPFVPPALGSYLVFLQNFAWPMPSTFYFITWSLCVEEWFYLLTAVTLFLLARAVGSRPRGARVAFGMTAAVLIVVPIALRFIPAVSQDPSWRTVVVVQIDSIMYGVLMAAARLYWPDLWRGPAAGVLLVLGAGAVLAARYLDPALSTPARALTPLGFACMLPFFDRLGRPAGLAAAAIEWLSLRSYSMYLCHALIYGIVWNAVDYESLATLPRLALKAGALLVTVIVSEATYRIYEKPMMDLRDRRHPRPGAKGGGT